MAVAVESLLRNAVGTVLVQLPQDQRLVARRRENHVRIRLADRDLRDPASVALQGRLQDQLVLACHDDRGCSRLILR